MTTYPIIGTEQFKEGYLASQLNAPNINPYNKDILPVHWERWKQGWKKGNEEKQEYHR